ncbi:hypothetical protein ACM61V_12135 [Sphingomonas sp. TX0543]|uniref:hypothetical protein n=1 Tax=unclassified Sphingomonas TaxID=196159 RepID=UPI0020168F29|nr:hypothetical protein [Sphingomonas sp. 3P27F8]
MLEFLEDFMQTHIDLRVRQFPRARGETPFERLRQSILIWTELVRANPGMMRCVVQMGDDDLNFRPDVQRFNMRLVVRVSERVLRYRAREDKDIAVLYTFSVSAMLDDLIRRYYIHPDAELRSIVDRVGPAEEVIADVVATIWMKVLYPEALLPQGTDEVIGAILNWTTPSAITG